MKSSTSIDTVYFTDPNTMNYSSYVGWGADANGAIVPVSIGIWSSFNKNHQATWLGTSVGAGIGAGRSIGLEYTFPSKGD